MNIHDSTATRCELSARVSDWDAQFLPPGSLSSIQLYEQCHVAPIAWNDYLALATECLFFCLNCGYLKSYNVKIDDKWHFLQNKCKEYLTAHMGYVWHEYFVPPACTILFCDLRSQKHFSDTAVSSFHMQPLMGWVLLLVRGPSEVIWGHPRSCGFTGGLLTITRYKMKIERRNWHHCVRFVELHRLICNMIYLGHHVTLTLGQIFNSTF